MIIPHSVDISCDRLLGRRVQLLQPRRGYRVAIDSVLLAAICPAASGDEVLDVGAGTGAVALCLAARVMGLAVTALERDPSSVALLRQAVQLNAAPIAIILGDVADPPSSLRQRSFTHIVTNPPFHVFAGSAQGEKGPAHRETVPLRQWLLFCLARLRSGGSLSLVHRADRLPDIVAVLSEQPCAITVLPIWPKSSSTTAKPPSCGCEKRLAVRHFVCFGGLVLHEENGHFTSTAAAILQDAVPIRLEP